MEISQNLGWEMAIGNIFFCSNFLTFFLCFFISSSLISFFVSFYFLPYLSLFVLFFSVLSRILFLNFLYLSLFFSLAPYHSFCTFFSVSFSPFFFHFLVLPPVHFLILLLFFPFSILCIIVFLSFPQIMFNVAQNYIF